jgi:FlaA1/EpsC-like NDP-sugar epimerase
VHPSNIMGASKRVCELLAQAYSRDNHCRFMAVRFGNVIGSIGSVVPLFRKQIAQGGPVTITHKDMTRYFMTIPEAARLIVQAGALGLGGEIFLLKMGTPIRIESIARDMITLSGWLPEQDIEIKYIGLRPGEKLHEELMTQDELMDKTDHAKIMIIRSQNHLSLDNLIEGIQRMCEEARTGNVRGIQRELKSIVPEYQFAE